MARTKAARHHYLQDIYWVKTRVITAADDGLVIETDGMIPANSLIIKPISGFQVNVAFDGTTLVDIGPTTDPNLWATAMVTTAIAFLPLDEAVTMLVSVDTQPVFTVAGGTVTVGSGVGLIAYMKL